jgi:hypothetical protein
MDDWKVVTDVKTLRTSNGRGKEGGREGKGRQARPFPTLLSPLLCRGISDPHWLPVTASSFAAEACEPSLLVRAGGDDGRQRRRGRGGEVAKGVYRRQLVLLSTHS